MYRTDLEYRILRGRMSIMPKGKCEELLDKIDKSARDVHILHLSQIKYLLVLQCKGQWNVWLIGKTTRALQYFKKSITLYDKVEQCPITFFLFL